MSDVHLIRAALDHLRSAKKLISMMENTGWELDDAIGEVIEALEHEEGEQSE